MLQLLPQNRPFTAGESKKLVQPKGTGLLRALLLLVALSTSFMASAQTPMFYKAGTATSGNTIPLNQASQKTQLLYAPGDFQSTPTSGLINKIYFRNSAAGATATYDDFQVRFAQTTDLSFPNNVFQTTGFTVAHFAATESVTGNAVAGGWFEIPLNSPFLYDNTQSLIVEIQYTARTGGISTTTSTSVGNKRKSGTSLTATTGTTNTIHNDFGMDIIPNLPCTAPPTAGTAAASVTTICANDNFNLTLSGNSIGSGQTYQWETSPNGTTGWTAIGTAGITPFLTTTQAAGTHFYRAAVTCSGQTAFSTVVSVTSPALISGTFTINAATATGGTNFQSFNDAINYIACGIGGPVVLNVVAGSGPYNEQVVIPAIGGMSATNTITINGNGNAINASPAASTDQRSVIQLNGADYVTINNLEINANGATYGWGIHFINGADFNTISNNTITVASTSTTESNSGGIIFTNSQTTGTTTGDNGSNNVITGNTIIGGYKGIGLYALPANAGSNQILNNTVQDFHATGIQVAGENAALVEGNNISRPTRTTTTTFAGIMLSGATQNTIISKNRIHNSHGAQTVLTGTAYGIFSSSNDAPTGSENIVRNNLVYNMNSNSIIYGIYNSGSDGVFYYHNTINLDNPNNTGTTRGFYQLTSASNIKFMNNIVRIVGGATGAKHAIYFGTAASTIDSDHNVLFVTSGATTSGVGFLGSNQLTLADWQTTTSKDASSVSVNPNFVDIAAGNFTPRNRLVNNIGTPVVPAVTDDITGAVRNTTTPDPGAYEFTIPAVDLGATALAAPVAKACFTNAEQVTVTIENMGSAPLNFSTNNATITVNVTGAVTQTLTTTLTDNTLNGGQPLAVGATLNVPVATLDMSATGNYTFNATTTAAGDGDATNNAMPARTIQVRPVSAGIAIGHSSLCAGDSTWLSLQGHNGSIQWQQFNGTTWVNATSAGATSDFFKITPTASAQFRAIVSGGTCPSDTSNVIAVNVGLPAISATQDDILCGSGQAALSATPTTGDVIKWYSAATGGTALATGNSFAPAVSATTSFYAEAARFKTAGNVGPIDHTIGNGGFGNFSNQTVFNVDQTMRLDFVTLISNGPLSFKVYLRDTVDGNFLDSAVVQLQSAGTHRVPLGFVIEPGQHYAIGIPRFTGSGQLWRSTDGTAFPYTLPGVVSITGTNFTPTTARYYYFYDWTVSTLTCTSARQAVTATVAAVNLGPDQTVCGATPVTLDAGNTGATYQWSLNNTVIPGAASQTLNVTASGTYVAAITVGTCTTTDTVTVTINPVPATPSVTLSNGVLTASAATGTYQWFSVSGTTLTPVPGATGATFTPTASGDYTVVVTVNGCESDPATTINVVLGIASLAPGMEVSVYPNPTAGKFTVNLVGFDKEATVQIMNVTGQVVAAEKVSITSDKASKAFDLGGMAKGVYILKVTSGNNLTFRKVILD